jgi:hypothetical protein
MAAGPFYSPATEAHLWAVKIFDDPVSARRIDVIAGIDWVVNNRRRYRASIVAMGFTCTPFKAMTDAVTAAIGKGIHFTGAAGNRQHDASTVFPGQSE